MDQDESGKPETAQAIDILHGRTCGTCYKPKCQNTNRNGLCETLGVGCPTCHGHQHRKDCACEGTGEVEVLVPDYGHGWGDTPELVPCGNCETCGKPFCPRIGKLGQHMTDEKGMDDECHGIH